MNKKNISITMLCVPLILLVLYNIKNNSNFFDAPIYTILNICVAIFFAYYLTQFKNDERKLKDKFKEYRDFMGNHIEDLEFLSKSQMDLLQKLELIDFKLDEIKIGFYKD